MAAVDLLALRKVYGALNAVDGIDLNIAHEELVCLLGPSGCGKTTTLRLLAGFVVPDAGTIVVGGRTISGPGTAVPPERRNMSMIFQSYALWPHMSVAENVAYGLKLRRLARADVERRVTRILDVTRLSPLRDRAPEQLSGGQQQRVALARALVVEPETLLLDEPLSNLDANLREEMRFEIRRLHDEFKIAMVYVTHDQAEAMVTSDRIVVMNKGRVEQIDAPFALYARPCTRFVAGFIGRTNFLEGNSDGVEVDFGAFSVAARALLGEGLRPGSVLASLRPQSIHLARSEREIAPDHCRARGRVQRRAYLGESWDYHVALEGVKEPLRVTTRAQDVFEVGDDVLAGIDAAQLTVIG